MPEASRKVVIAGAGLAGLAAAKYLTDAGHKVLLLEKREVAGGKASSWQDADGDWLESGLHVFFGAYRNLLSFLRETDLYDNLTWMPHCLTFSKPGGQLSPLRFPAFLPAPLHGLTAIARNRGVLTNPDKLRTGVGLLWPILGNQPYIDRQDNLSYEAWHLRHGLSCRSLGDFFDTMALALNFGKSRDVSAKLLLTVLSHFGKETDAETMDAVPYAVQLGVALQLTNILKGRGRGRARWAHLPAERRHGALRLQRRDANGRQEKRELYTTYAVRDRTRPRPVQGRLALHLYASPR